MSIAMSIWSKTKSSISSPTHKGLAKRKARRRSGSIVVLVAVCLVALCGFCGLAVDYGRMVATRNQLQRTCDAGALAGAIDLPITATATTNAQKAANGNGVNTSELDITFPATNQIRVKATRQVSLLFMPVLGVKFGTVNATALAGRSSLSGVPIVPLAITVDDYNKYGKGSSTFGTGTSVSVNTPFQGPNYGQTLTVDLIRNTKEDFTPGTVTALDLRPNNSGASPAQFQEDVEEGYNGAPVSMNTDADALRASENAQGAKLYDGLQTRFDRAAEAPWNIPASSATFPYTFPAYGGREDNPRIMMILIGNPNPADNNQPQIYARAFVPVYVESIANTGSEGAVMKIRLLPQYTFNNTNPNLIIGNDNTPSTGVSIVRLLS